jgi:hypothetical protein
VVQVAVPAKVRTAVRLAAEGAVGAEVEGEAVIGEEEEEEEVEAVLAI